MSKFIEKANNQYTFDHCITAGDVSKQLRKNIERFGYASLVKEIQERTNFDYVRFAKSVGIDYQASEYHIGFLKLQNEIVFGEAPPKKKRNKKSDTYNRHI